MFIVRIKPEIFPAKADWWEGATSCHHLKTAAIEAFGPTGLEISQSLRFFGCGIREKLIEMGYGD
ncbi:MAG: hypothetical protein Kow0037_31500 [Calditrichia bacterium]